MLGIFDSGLGGLTVVKEVRRQLPGVRMLYFGDTARMPYGTKSKTVVTKYAVEDARFLVRKGVAAVIVACNTASAHAIGVLRRELRIPVFEMVEPAVAAGLQATKGRLGVIATSGTISSGIYERSVRRLSPSTKVWSRPCPLFVPLVEEGMHSGAAVRDIAKTYLHPLGLRGIDTLILGCTHYPFLRRVIGDVMGRGITLIDPAKEVVARLVEALEDNPALDKKTRQGRDQFFVSDVTPRFQKLASQWLQEKITLEKKSF